jgi:hypothetical protein
MGSLRHVQNAIEPCDRAALRTGRVLFLALSGSRITYCQSNFRETSKLFSAVTRTPTPPVERRSAYTRSGERARAQLIEYQQVVEAEIVAVSDVSSDARAGPMVEIQQVRDKEPSDG